MQALLVVDIDHNDNWGPKYIQENNQKKQVMEEIKKVLKEKRAKKEIIVFIVLNFLLDFLVMGQSFLL